MKSAQAKVRLGQFTLHYDSSAIHAQLISALSTDPDRLFADGQVIVSPWQTAATDKTIVTVGGRSYFFKRYNNLGFGYQVKNIFRHSRAMKSWLAGWKWLEFGLPTPHPIACMEERSLRMLGRSYLLFESIDRAQSLLDCWANFDAVQKREVLALLGADIGRMHRLGFLHGDLNWRNILIRDISGSLGVYFVDLDGCKVSPGLTTARAQKDMNHFFRDMQRNCVTDDDTQLFFAAWEKAFRFR